MIYSKGNSNGVDGDVIDDDIAGDSRTRAESVDIALLLDYKPARITARLS
jgi:hypothetical protein